MVGHIKQLCRSYIRAAQKINPPNDDIKVNISTWPKLIYEEINELKTTDFDPSARYDFVLIRVEFSYLARKHSTNSNEYPSFIKLSQKLISIMDSYLTGGHEKAIRDFSFLQSIDLKNIVERDYRELHCILIPEGAWKSAVVMAGSILESILFDMLSNEENLDKANKSPKAPEKRGKLQSERWSLMDLINVSVDVGILPEQRANSIDQVLRDYRNFVHPMKEIKSKHPCTEAEAFMAKGCLDGICNHLLSMKS